jgi:hypothetical protein
MPKSARPKPSTAVPASVEAFLAALEHPRKPEILALRRIILDVDPGIREGIKWNAPSFSTSEHFATFHLRAKDGVQIILHLGAKVRASATTGVVIADPSALLEWLAADRAAVKFRDLRDIEARGAAFAAVLRQWIALL